MENNDQLEKAQPTSHQTVLKFPSVFKSLFIQGGFTEHDWFLNTLLHTESAISPTWEYMNSKTAQ